MLKVYIAGPYAKGDVAVNVKNAIDAADRLIEIRCVPFVPHLFHFWHILSPHEYDVWMNLDMEWLRQCDVVLRLSGDSEGADKEVQLAKQLGKHVYTSVESLIKVISGDNKCYK
jgi:hypothetical protein